MSSLFHGAEVREGVLVSGDATVMAFCRHENKNNFVVLDIDEKRLFCDSSVTKWLPNAVAGHLTRLSKTLTERAAPVMASSTKEPAGSGTSTAKKPRSNRKR
jgi:hypothetical protein